MEIRKLIPFFIFAINYLVSPSWISKCLATASLIFFFPKSSTNQVSKFSCNSSSSSDSLSQDDSSDSLSQSEDSQEFHDQEEVSLNSAVNQIFTILRMSLMMATIGDYYMYYDNFPLGCFWFMAFQFSLISIGHFRFTNAFCRNFILPGTLGALCSIVINLTSDTAIQLYAIFCVVWIISTSDLVWNIFGKKWGYFTPRESMAEEYGISDDFDNWIESKALNSLISNSIGQYSLGVFLFLCSDLCILINTVNPPAVTERYRQIIPMIIYWASLILIYTSFFRTLNYDEINQEIVDQKVINPESQIRPLIQRLINYLDRQVDQLNIDNTISADQQFFQVTRGIEMIDLRKYAQFVLSCQKIPKLNKKFTAEDIQLVSFSEEEITPEIMDIWIMDLEKHYEYILTTYLPNLETVDDIDLMQHWLFDYAIFRKQQLVYQKLQLSTQ